MSHAGFSNSAQTPSRAHTSTSFHAGTTPARGLSASKQAQRMTFPKRAVITCGMPYGNKNLHFGHIGGVFVPADFFARFMRDRIGAENVVFVSGTDCFGSPIMEGHRKREQQGYTGSILDYVKENHNAQKAALDAYGISLNLYLGSGLEPAAHIHQELTYRVLERLHSRGYLTKRSTKQFFDTTYNQLLNGRQVIGRCPVRGCKSEKAYADECDLGHQFDPEELIAPISQLSNTTPELRYVDNWYFDLPRFQHELEDLCTTWDNDDLVRDVVSQTVRESLAAPVMYIQDKFRDAFNSVADTLPQHTVCEAQKGQQSFSVCFGNWEDRDCARGILEDAHIRFRTGKTLLPFRITGNISWGVKAPTLENTDGLTVWCWPESLWAPISFTQTALELDKAQTNPQLSTHDWKQWWCSDDSNVYQFMGQDNIYFYCVAQPAIWQALDWGLTNDIPVANYHILFMNKKASSSSDIKPPMAAELLDSYKNWQLRAHWLSLALDTKAVSFSPKAFDTSCSHVDKQTGMPVAVKDDPRVSDPALKETAFLTNIFNRLARSCFYGAQKSTNGCLPGVDADELTKETCADALIAFETEAGLTHAHSALAHAEELVRWANKRWGDDAKAAVTAGDDTAYAQALANAFYCLRAGTLMLHPCVYEQCETIAQMMNFDAQLFFSWEYAFIGPYELAQLCGHRAEEHQLQHIEPRFDFFKKA